MAHKSTVAQLLTASADGPAQVIVQVIYRLQTQPNKIGRSVLYAHRPDEHFRLVLAVQQEAACRSEEQLYRHTLSLMKNL
jgi:hypothetical protein